LKWRWFNSRKSVNASRDEAVDVIGMQASSRRNLQTPMHPTFAILHSTGVIGRRFDHSPSYFGQRDVSQSILAHD
jgi:hypothetical protein